jgi:hypothetical protein
MGIECSGRDESRSRMGRGERQALEKVYDQRCGEALLLSGAGRE